jgi:hypothetical protein
MQYDDDGDIDNKRANNLDYNNVVKVKQSRYTPWRRLGERRYNFYSFTTSALDEGEWSASRPGRALAQVKGPSVAIGQEAGWAQSRSGHRG